MSTRPREHVLETESRRAFEQWLPAEWVVRPQDIDYGIDAQVQVFEGGHATTSFFFAQLKATDSIDIADESPGYRFSTERLLYYVNCPLPVMLVLYDAAGRRLFYLWVHSLFKRLTQDEERKWRLQKTVIVRFAQRLDGADMLSLAREVRRQPLFLGQSPDPCEPFTIGLTLNIPESMADKTRLQLRGWLSDDAATSFIKVRDVSSDEVTDAVIAVTANPNMLIAACGDDSVVLPLSTSPDEDISHDQIVASLQLTVASVLSFGGRIGSALDVITRFIIRRGEVIAATAATQGVVAAETSPFRVEIYGKV